MNSFSDLRSQEIKNWIDGWWFTEDRTPAKIAFEMVGRGMALTLRVLHRRKIGTETYSFGMVVMGFLWIRLCTCWGIPADVDKTPFNNLFNLMAFHSPETTTLNILSIFFLAACLGHFLYGEFFHHRSKEPLDVLERGENAIFRRYANDGRSIFRKNSFFQAIVFPVIFGGLGLGFWYFDMFNGLSAYLMVSALALALDEGLYHRALVLKDRRSVAHEHRARKMMKDYHKRSR